MADAATKTDKTPEEKELRKKKRDLRDLKAQNKQMGEAHKAAAQERKALQERIAKLTAELGLPAKVKKARPGKGPAA